MKHAEAEKLLGGYATGTLTQAERQFLFAAALEHQDIFEALVDEEALRELLADPVAKAQLLGALAPASPPKVVPFWRRTGVLGAAAGFLVAATAGLAYLRSPDQAPPPLSQETVKAPAAKVVETAALQAPATAERKGVLSEPAKAEPAKGLPTPIRAAELPAQAAPPPMPQPMAAPAVALADSAQMKEKADFRRTEARDQLAKKAEAPRSAAAVVEVVSSQKDVAPEPRAQGHVAGGVPGGVPGGVIGGVVGGVIGGGVAGPPASTTAKAKALSGGGMNAATAPTAPTWILETQLDGSTRVTVKAARGLQVVLLRRGSGGVEELKLQAVEDRGIPLVQWRGEVRLAPGDGLDLYLLNHAVADPSKLLETGPVDGIRVRIYPTVK